MPPKFDSLQPAKKEPGDTPATVLARQLRGHLEDAGYGYWAQVSKATKHFNKLLRARTFCQIQETMEWYFSHPSRLAGPAIRSAAMLIRAYPRIEELMALDPSRIQLSPAQEELHKRWHRRGWPAGLDLYLPLIIKRSWDNYEAFLPKVLPLQETLKAAGGHKRHLGLLLEYCAAKYFFCPSDFVHLWLERLQRTLQYIPSWNGTPEGLFFAVHGQRFMKVGQQWAYEFCEQSEWWDELMEFFK